MFMYCNVIVATSDEDIGSLAGSSLSPSFRQTPWIPDQLVATATAPKPAASNRLPSMPQGTILTSVSPKANDSLSGSR